MLPFVRKYHQVLFYLCWLGINLLQAANTDLIDDEAYYWVYGHFLDWGYFDHPPMVALIIKTGYHLFHNELGVRLLLALLNTGTIYLISRLLSKKNDLLFYAIAGSMAVAQIGGILAVPDIPLLFFTALFFFQYRRFLHTMNTANSLLLGLCMAALLYSKYHGVLIIFFTLLSNPKLFTRYQSYIAGLFTVALFVPHLYWQYQHHFPSVQYHLFERNASEYKFNFTIEYLIGQIALAGPLMGWLLLWAAFSYKPSSLFERALKFSMAGLYGFFLLSTLKGRVEANWTIPAFIPLMVLSHQFLVTDPSHQRWLYKSLPATLIMIFLVRIYLLSFMPPVNWLSKDDEIHRTREWVNEVSDRAAKLPVVFMNSYQKASKYWFYSGDRSFSLNDIEYRRNNYNFWPLEDSLLGKKVMVAGRYDQQVFQELFSSTGADSLASAVIDPYFSFSRIRFSMQGSPRMEKDVLRLTGEWQTPVNYLPVLQQSPYDTASLYFAFFLKDEKPLYLPAGFKVKDLARIKQVWHCQQPVTLAKGKYLVRMGFSTAIPGYYSLNCKGFELEIE